MLRKIRIISQITFFSLFAINFFSFTAFPQGYKFQSEWFLWLNPLTSIVVSIASRKIILVPIIISSAMIILTIVFGRFFCGMVCPLGALIDFSDRFLFRRLYTGKKTIFKKLHSIKYILLFGIVVLALFGSVFYIFTGPISLITRFFTLVIYPLTGITLAQVQPLLAPVINKIDFVNFGYTTVKTSIFYGIGETALLLLIVLGLGLFDKRFWCQYICPSGAFLALLSNFALFKRITFSDRCNKCKACMNVCPTHAIDKEGVITSFSECILCGKCTALKISSEKRCNSFGFSKPLIAGNPGPQISRRQAVASIFGGLVALPVIKSDAFAKRGNTGRLIRPPGSIPEKDFISRCISCGACMKACPTNAIQPCTLSDGFYRLFTPKIVPRIGGCEEKCHICGYVCPTGAIRALTYEDKRFVKIGTAVVNRDCCLAWEQNKVCLLCDEICPYNAITARIVYTTTGKFKVPVVDEDICIGCGMCEQVCPVDDKAAIEVYKFGEVRRLKGAYVTEWQKEEIDKKRHISDSKAGAGFFTEDIGDSGDLPLSGLNGDNSISSSNVSKDTSLPLPPGFSE